jgi:predicted nucleic acid-binding protein
MILDTNALSAFIDGEPTVGALLSHAERVAIPVIVLGEFRYGSQGPGTASSTNGGWPITSRTSTS